MPDFKPANWAVTASLYTRRPVREINPAHLATTPWEETFSEFPISPMRLIVLASFFNQSKKFLIPRRTEQWRFRETAPFYERLASDKLFHLTQHAPVNGRITDDAFAFVRFGLPRFKLWFDQRRNPT